MGKRGRVLYPRPSGSVRWRWHLAEILLSSYEGRRGRRSISSFVYLQ